MRYTKMDKMVMLIHYLDSDATDEQKINEILLFRDEGVINDEEGVDLVTAYKLQLQKKMDTYYIEYRVNEDNHKYCTYITASNRDEAIETFKGIEKDLKRIVNCEIAY